MEQMRQFEAGVFEALADPTRIALVECLVEGGCTVSQLCERVGVGPDSAVRHLAVLRFRHVVCPLGEGDATVYALCDPRLARVLEAMREFFQDHVGEALQALLNEPEDGPQEPDGLDGTEGPS